jgi:threonine dehydratase
VDREGAEEVARRIAAGGVRAAQAPLAELVRRTPLLNSGTLERRCGGRILLKAESLQRTGSFKLRGAFTKLLSLDQPQGVVAGSAGNHAQALAYAAQQRGVPCVVYMPSEAPVAKVAAVGSYGGTVVLRGDTVEECVEAASEHAQQSGEIFVHPFDDAEVIIGQGTLGVELLDDVAELGMVILPLGGGGLASGVAGAIKLARPDVTIVAVQAEGAAAFPPSLAAGAPVTSPSASTIADGIAVKRPGALTLPLVERFVDDVVVVADDDIAEAMVLLMERAKLVVEGAGAVGVAALLAGAVEPVNKGTTVVVLSGGNVDVAQRHEVAVGRRLRIATAVSDRPGGLAALLTCVAQAGANLVTVEHVREAAELHVRQTGVELTLETRGADHAEQILSALLAAGYGVQRLGGA